MSILNMFFCYPKETKNNNNPLFLLCYYILRQRFLVKKTIHEIDISLYDRITLNRSIGV